MCIESIKRKQIRNLISELDVAYRASLLKGFYIQSNFVGTRHVLHIYLHEQQYDNIAMKNKLTTYIQEKYKASVIAVTGQPCVGPMVINVYLDAEL